MIPPISYEKPYIFEFEETRLPKMTNSMMGVAKYGTIKHKHLWENTIYDAVMVKRHPMPPKPLTHAKVTLTRRSARQPDYDGLVSGFKFIIDALVRNAILIDDNPSVIGTPEYKWEKAPPDGGSMKIRVEEIL